MATLYLRKPILLIRPLALGLGLIIATAVSADTGNQTKQETGTTIATERQPTDHIHFLIPGGAGGGWDRTARGVGQALIQSNLIQSASFENMSGGGGARGIAHTIELKNPNLWLINSTPIVVRSLQKIFPQSFRDLAPIASVIGDYSVIAVPHNSTFNSLADLLAAQQKQPRKIAFAGGSVAGGTDHIVAAMVVKGFGGDPRATKYIPYDAGGKAMAGLLSGEVNALSSGFGEVADLARQGWVRILCITARQRLAGAPQIPTCAEAGAEQAVFVNWRGFFATPNLPPTMQRQYQDLLAALYEAESWQKIRDRNGWVDLFNPGRAFSEMLLEQERTVGNLMRELGLL